MISHRKSATLRWIFLSKKDSGVLIMHCKSAGCHGLFSCQKQKQKTKTKTKQKQNKNEKQKEQQYDESVLILRRNNWWTLRWIFLSKEKWHRRIDLVS